jgi:hypothetical protein
LNKKCYFISPPEDNQLKNYSAASQYCLDQSAQLITIDNYNNTGYPLEMFQFIGSIEWNLDYFWVKLDLNLFLFSLESL